MTVPGHDQNFKCVGLASPVPCVLALMLAFLAAATGDGAMAQKSARPRRLGVLAPVFCPAPNQPTYTTTPLLQALAQLGWIENRTLVVDCVGPSGRSEQIPALAAELVARKPDVLFGASTVVVRALKRATATIPIVTAASDPLGSGIVTNLAHPDANVTGLAPMSFDLVAKRTELLRDVLPRFTRLAVIYSGGTEPTEREQMQRDIAAAGQALGFSWEIFDAKVTSDIDDIFDQVETQGFDAAYIWPSSFTLEHRSRIAATALQHRVPAISDRADDVRDGLLLSYGLDDNRLMQSAAVYIDKILQGAKPADLPLQQPTKLELVINLRIAKALNLAVPQSILLRADEVIE